MNHPTTIYLVRHGQTVWNTEHRFQGHQDSPLTKQGIQQAEWLSESLQNVHLDHIYASTSGRASRTADILKGDRNIPMTQTDDLMEQNLGVWEGRVQEEIQQLYPEQWESFWKNPSAFYVDASETYQEVLKRAVSLLQHILNEHAGQSVLLVTHTVVVKLLMAYFEGRPLRELWNLPYIHPTCLCKVEVYSDRSDIILHGDTSHYRMIEENQH
ncbi:histidine phosphatase family protein [Paenibacillus selenitireducens]|uniref:Histidine phosphatase family protein n=1 Tax=Paenibacillus selenitireducens TaxID=1324314 RepID=A0A1T2X1J8_9BACL|nr:histidine phosphatase family protein [Paenibacillus selenitireducens]OPA73717.1 histidine phosphatase family protein [Paenibacillus selenitireducens]